VLTSVGKSRAVVNRFAAVSRVAGPATIVIQITVSAMVISSAPSEERGRVAVREGRCGRRRAQRMGVAHGQAVPVWRLLPHRVSSCRSSVR
jgi:hypothetical protein